MNPRKPVNDSTGIQPLTEALRLVVDEFRDYTAREANRHAEHP
jgi:hypothetical protein